MSFAKRDQQLLKSCKNYRVSPSVESEAIRNYLQSLDCPRALAVWIMFSNDEHDQLAALSFDPLFYESVERLRSAYMATKLLSKFVGLNTSFDLDKVAMHKFSEFEDLCKLTNGRFRNLSHDPQYVGHVVWLHNAVIRKIDRLLGEFDPEEFVALPDWGPGASTTIKRRDASAAVKFQIETGITRDLYALISSGVFETCYPHWHSHLSSKNYPDFQVGNRVITVPKDATSNRVIAIEPGINLWFQKALGEMIGRRLRRVGIDLRDQGRNQRLAKIGSREGTVATVDLSSASDSVSRSVVEELLPPRWYRMLDTCRTHYGQLNGSLVRWEKFSSMGNGFTFQLESLIFYAIAICCAEYQGANTNHVSVYGDDIIVPTETFDLLSEMLSFYGFRVNNKKSHYRSSFRESCGAHYVSGFDAKPVYLKDRIETVGSVYRFANAIRRLAHRQMNHVACDARFRSAFDSLVSSVPKALRLRIPETLGDGGFVSNLDEACPTRARHGIEGYRVQHLVTKSKTLCFEETGYHLASLWRLSKFSPNVASGEERPSILSTISVSVGLNRDAAGLERNSVPAAGTGLRLTKSIVYGWSDLGPWIC